MKREPDMDYEELHFKLRLLEIEGLTPYEALLALFPVISPVEQRSE